MAGDALSQTKTAAGLRARRAHGGYLMVLPQLDGVFRWTAAAPTRNPNRDRAQPRTIFSAVLRRSKTPVTIGFAADVGATVPLMHILAAKAIDGLRMTDRFTLQSRSSLPCTPHHSRRSIGGVAFKASSPKWENQASVWSRSISIRLSPRSAVVFFVMSLLGNSMTQRERVFGTRSANSARAGNIARATWPRQHSRPDVYQADRRGIRSPMIRELVRMAEALEVRPFVNYLQGRGSSGERERGVDPRERLTRPPEFPARLRPLDSPQRGFTEPARCF